MKHVHMIVKCIHCGTIVKQCKCETKEKALSYASCDECRKKVLEELGPDNPYVKGEFDESNNG